MSDEAIRAALERFFQAFERGTSATRLGIYAEALEKVGDPERVVAMLERVVTEWDKGSPPPIAVLMAELGRGKAAGKAGEADPELTKREREKFYHLLRYSDADQHLFRDVYGETPSRALFVRYEIQVPEGVTFRPMSRAECEEIRRSAWAETRKTLEDLIAARKIA